MAIVSEQPSRMTGEPPLRTGRAMGGLFAAQTYALGRGNRMRLLTAGVVGTLAGWLLSLINHRLTAAGWLDWLSDAPEWLANAVPAGLPAVFGVPTALLVFLMLRPRFESFFVAGEEFWLSSEVYKRTQGRRLRTLTFASIGLFIGWGLLSISERLKLVPKDVWPSWVPVAQLAPYWIPAILLAITAWAVFRIVNWPRFADFLIATEAEMTKVSWSTKDELIRATLVVLTTVMLLAAFLLAMDIVWSWVLERIGVLQVPKPEAWLDWQSVPSAAHTVKFLWS
jgi:preprotein translocase subunit SecE